MKKWKHPIMLNSNGVALVPLLKEDVPDLHKAVNDGGLWKLWFASVPHPNKIEEYIEAALEMQQEGESITFAIWDEVSKQFIGCTRFCNLDSKYQRMEIGYTWYAKSFLNEAI
ncbi:MAG: RimJ/RimL family protein N-acetyltransferase [Marivirga sp.]|jgi:RimJ/RimL family protein N-acetyltransferase